MGRAILGREANDGEGGAQIKPLTFTSREWTTWTQPRAEHSLGGWARWGKGSLNLEDLLLLYAVRGCAFHLGPHLRSLKFPRRKGLTFL